MTFARTMRLGRQLCRHRGRPGRCEERHAAPLRSSTSLLRQKIMKDRMTMTTYYNDVFGAEPDAGEPNAVSQPAPSIALVPMPHHEVLPALDGTHGSDGADG